MAKILLVEDDGVLREGLYELFTREGYETNRAACAKEADALLSADTDLIVLDVTLPDGDGVSLLKKWRSDGVSTPVLFLTAKDEEFDVVRALDAGGNDYVTKPFRMMELLSRMRVLTRNAPSFKETILQKGDIEIDKAKMSVKKSGETLMLTLTEYKLLLKMMESKFIVTRQTLLETLWDAEGKFIDDNTLSVHMSRLREKIGHDRIKTVRGVGYQWSDT